MIRSTAPHLRQGNLRQSLALFGARVAIVLGVASALAPTSALAELQVGGSPESVTIDAQNTSIKEILDTLGKTFDVHIQSTANLEKQLTGTYEGSLPRVLKRVLEGYNVVMKTNKNRIEITVLGTRNATATAGVSPALTAATTVQPVSAASPVPASNLSSVTEQPVLPGKDTVPPMLSASPSGSSSIIVLAEGPTPPLPSASGSAPNAFPAGQPTAGVAPPTPVVGSAPSTFPMGKATSTLPPAPAAGTAPAPVAGNNLTPAR